MFFCKEIVKDPVHNNIDAFRRFFRKQRLESRRETSRRSVTVFFIPPIPQKDENIESADLCQLTTPHYPYLHTCIFLSSPISHIAVRTVTKNLIGKSIDGQAKGRKLIALGTLRFEQLSALHTKSRRDFFSTVCSAILLHIGRLGLISDRFYYLVDTTK